MKIQDVFLLLLLAAVWGASFLFVRVAVPTLGPFPLVAARVLMGGALLLLYAMLNGSPIEWRKRWRQYLLIGLFNNAIPFTLIATAQLDLTASLAALLNSTTPLFSALIAAIWIKDALTPVKITGLICGIIGVGIVVGWVPETVDSTRFISILLMLVATFSYGIGAVYGKVAFSGHQPIATATGQLLASSLLIIPFAAANPPTMPLNVITVGAMVGLAILSTSLAYIIYFHLIDSAGPTTATSVTLLIPFFSSLWGAIFLNERLYANEIIGFVIILVGLCLVTGLWKQLIPKQTVQHKQI